MRRENHLLKVTQRPSIGLFAEDVQTGPGQVILLQGTHESQILGAVNATQGGDRGLQTEALFDQVPQALAGPQGVRVGTTVGQDQDAIRRAGAPLLDGFLKHTAQVLHGQQTASGDGAWTAGAVGK